MSDDELRALYRDVVLEHYRHPRGRTPLAHPEGRGLAVNTVCGDQAEVELALGEDARVAEVSARAVGCAIAVASASVLTELVRGCERAQCTALAEALAEVVRSGEAAASLDARLRAFAPVAQLPGRHRCASLAWEALAQAFEEAAER